MSNAIVFRHGKRIRTSYRKRLLTFIYITCIGSLLSLMYLNFSLPHWKQITFSSYYSCESKVELVSELTRNNSLREKDVNEEINTEYQVTKVGLTKKYTDKYVIGEIDLNSINSTKYDIQEDNITDKNNVKSNETDIDKLYSEPTKDPTSKVPIWERIGETCFPTCPVDATLLIMVSSSPNEFIRRDTIRQTWGKPLELSNGARAITVFLIGESNSSTTNYVVKAEAVLKGDIFLGDYVDSYRNLTLKTLNGLVWTSRCCRPKFVLKTDTDCFVNTYLLLNHLREYAYNSNNLYVGRYNSKMPAIRNKKSKWYVSESEFQDNYFPPYGQGYGYILSGDLIPSILVEARKTPIISMEDAFIGVLAHKLKIPVINSFRFTVDWKRTKYNTCYFVYIMVLHHISPEEQHVYQNLSNLARSQTVAQCSRKSWIKW